MRGVTGNMRGGGGMTGRTCGGPSRSIFGVAGGSMGGQRGSPCLANGYLVMRPGPPCFNSFPGPVISRVFFFKVWKHPLGAVSGPEYH